MLELAVPVLRGLTQTPGHIDAQAAMAFFMIGAVHVALMVLVLKVAGTMVAGWTVFGLTGSGKDAERAAPALAPAAPAAVQAATLSEAERPAPSRAIRLGAATPMAANDTAPAGGTTRETRIVAAAASREAASSASPNASLSRTRGIGSRFRAPANARLARSLEKSS